MNHLTGLGEKCYCWTFTSTSLVQVYKYFIKFRNSTPPNYRMKYVKLVLTHANAANENLLGQIIRLVLHLQKMKKIESKVHTLFEHTSLKSCKLQEDAIYHFIPTLNLISSNLK